MLQSGRPFLQASFPEDLWCLETKLRHELWLRGIVRGRLIWIGGHQCVRDVSSALHGVRGETLHGSCEGRRAPTRMRKGCEEKGYRIRRHGLWGGQ